MFEYEPFDVNQVCVFIQGNVNSAFLDLYNNIHYVINDVFCVFKVISRLNPSKKCTGIFVNLFDDVKVADSSCWRISWQTRCPPFSQYGCTGTFSSQLQNFESGIFIFIQSFIWSLIRTAVRSLLTALVGPHPWPASSPPLLIYTEPGSVGLKLLVLYFTRWNDGVRGGWAASLSIYTNANRWVF